MSLLDENLFYFIYTNTSIEPTTTTKPIPPVINKDNVLMYASQVAAQMSAANMAANLTSDVVC